MKNDFESDWAYRKSATLLYSVHSIEKVHKLQLGLIANRPTQPYTVHSLGLSQIGPPCSTQCTVELIANRPTLLYTMYSLDLSQIGPPYCAQITAWAYCKLAYPTVHSVQLGLIANRPTLQYTVYSLGLSQIRPTY